MVGALVVVVGGRYADHVRAGTGRGHVANGIHVQVAVGGGPAVEDAGGAQGVIETAPQGIVVRVGLVDAPAAARGHHEGALGPTARVPCLALYQRIGIAGDHVALRKAADANGHQLHVPVGAGHAHGIVAPRAHHARAAGTVAAAVERVVIVRAGVPAVHIVDVAVVVIIHPVTVDLEGVHPGVRAQVRMRPVEALDHRHDDVVAASGRTTRGGAPGQFTIDVLVMPLLPVLRVVRNGTFLHVMIELGDLNAGAAAKRGQCGHGIGQARYQVDAGRGAHLAQDQGAGRCA